MTNPEDTIYPDLASAQAALDRGETVRIEMQSLTINPALVQLAQDLQDQERLQILENFAAHITHAHAELIQSPGPELPVQTEYCCFITHRGGWNCPDCYKLQHPEEYRQFLDDTVGDEEYNAYLEHIHTPKASEY